MADKQSIQARSPTAKWCLSEVVHALGNFARSACALVCIELELLFKVF
jgi:hypothetical protein